MQKIAQFCLIVKSLNHFNIRISKTQGKLMFFTKKEDVFSDFNIDLSAFDSRLYFVKLNSSKGEIIKKLILNA